MKQTWRWFGPHDTVSVDDMLQAGVQGVVTALHHVPTGAVWSQEEIARRQALVARMKDGSPSGLAWDVVESLPVSEDIKKQSGQWRDHVANYQTSLRNLARCGIEVVCYNFMPVLDWTRTDLGWRLPHGGTCMRFDFADFAAFDIHILRRRGAADSFPSELVELAGQRYALMDEARKRELATNVVFGLPGAADHMTLEDVRVHLEEYRSIDADRLSRHFHDFLEQVTPVAQEVGIRINGGVLGDQLGQVSLLEAQEADPVHLGLDAFDHLPRMADAGGFCQRAMEQFVQRHEVGGTIR